MGREGGGTMLGGGIITAGHAEAWDHVSLTAGFDAWHHVAMIYDGAALHFLEVIEPEAASKTSNLVSVNNLLFIGQETLCTAPNRRRRICFAHLEHYLQHLLIELRYLF